MTLFFRHYGDGPPLIILHGLYGMSDNWVTMGQRLAGKFCVRIPDLRNHGHSPHSPTHNYPAMADDVREFIAEQGINEAIILGHSMGGKVAMTLAVESPKLISKLIVIDIAPKNYNLRNIHLDILKAMLSVDFKTVSQRNEVEKMISGQVADPRIRLFIQKNLFRRERNAFGWRVNLQAISDNLDFLADSPELHGTFAKPCLFVRGGKSDYIMDEDILMIHKIFPESILKTIPEAGHWVHADAPEALFKILQDFTY
ncbi:MAG: alpha/beta fold hydrolase [Bacteroidota bacterium]